MRRFSCLYFFILLFALCFVGQSIEAAEIVVDSRVTAATIYNDRAQITRSAKLDIPAGAHTLIFKGLPPVLFTDSLRAKGASSAEVVFGSLDHKRNSSKDYIIPKEKEINAQIEKLEDENKLYNADKSALGVTRTFLDNLGKNSSLRENEEIAKLELNPQEWAGAADTLTAKFSENLKLERTLDMKIRENIRKIDKLRKDLRELHTGHKQSYSVSLPLESNKATKLSVDLIYQISGVSWRPVYEARLDVKSTQLDLIQYGLLRQRTGEDWEDIALTLSTARPGLGAGLPDLNTDWISFSSRNRAKETFSGSFAAADAMLMEKAPVSQAVMSDKAAMPVKRRQKAHFQSARINTQGFIGEYIIPGLVDVKANGSKSKVMIGSFETDSKLEVQVKPQLDAKGYLVAKATLKGEAPILPGSVSLFRDGAYIGRTQTDMLRPGDETRLAFGIDDNIVVTRNILEDKHSETGVISVSNVQEKSFVTRIKNLHKKPISVALLETIPVSQDERINVSIIKDHTTKGYESDFDNVKGLLRWSMKIDSKKEIPIKLGWQVNWPKGEFVSGL